MLTFVKRKLHNLLADKKFSEILTGSAWALGARVIATGLGLISSIIIARFYGAEVMGVVAVINSFLLLATIFSLLGTDTSILRLVAEHLVKYSATSAFRVYRKTQYLVIVVSLITGTLFFFGANVIAGRVFSKPHLSFYFALAAVFVLFKSLMLLNTQAVRGLRLIKTFALMQTLPQGFNLLLLLLLGLLVSNKDVPVYAMLGGFALTGMLGWVIMEYSFREKSRPCDQVESMPASTVLSISLPMLMTQTMTFVIAQTGVMMLGMFRSEADVGHYAVAVKLATLTSFILSAVNSMAGPKFSELFHSGRMDELFYVARRSAKLIFVTTAPILLFLVFLGRQLLGFLFGKEFAVAYWAMVFLVIGQFAHSACGSTAIFMNMTGRQKQLFTIKAIAALLNVLLNMILTPHYGIYGAALAAMLSLSFWNILTLLLIRKVYGQTIGYFPVLSNSL